MDKRSRPYKPRSSTARTLDVVASVVDNFHTGQARTHPVEKAKKAAVHAIQKTADDMERKK